MDLLTNAVESIQLGVEDFQAGSRPRLLSALRNIHAGILLLYKEALRRRSPDESDEVLVKAKIVPRQSDDGELEFVGVGEKTLDVQQIKERFDGLKIATEWARFDAITKVRNKIEHYYSTITQKALTGVIADAFMIVRAFIANELQGDPRELLGETTWQAMLSVAEIYAAERAECDKEMASVNWQSESLANGACKLTCEQCGSDLLTPLDATERYEEVTLRCRACGADEPAETFVPRAVEAALAFDMYLVGDDGAELPYVSCPECGADAYVIEEQRCASCGHEAEHKCALCGNTIPPEELDSSPYCGWCAYQMAKDD